MVSVTNRSGLRAALESTSGTVTSFLEQLVGESIDAQVHRHDVVGAPRPNNLEVAEGESLLERAAVLRGRISGSSYVYAESVIVTSRLPAGFLGRLACSKDPIGRILDDIGIAVTRENVIEPHGLADFRSSGAMTVGEYLLSRTYRLHSDQTPVMIITEWFLPALSPFLSST
jgi:chorismate--pyruvate lyase